MLILWVLAGLIAGSLLNLAIHWFLSMEKEGEPLPSYEPPQPRPLHHRSALLYAVFGRVGRGSASAGGPDGFALGVELSTAAAFGLLFLRIGPEPRLLLASLYTCILVVVFVVDWRRHLIYDAVTYPSALLAIVLTPLLSSVNLAMCLLGLAVGGLVFALFYGLGYAIFRREALGLGDVKLAMVLGAMLGFPAIVVAMLATSVIGGVAAAAMLIAGRSGREFMPYGTAMCLGAYVTLLINAPRP